LPVADSATSADRATDVVDLYERVKVGTRVVVLC
jgi:hypothetical protein